MELTIDNAILHILDTGATLPVFSTEELELNEKIYEYILKHIDRLFEDQSVKTGKFIESSKVKEMILAFEDFIAGSTQLADHMFKLMIRYGEIPDGDLLVAKFTLEDDSFLVILKFNYKEGYTHYVDYGERGTHNKIVVNRVMLPEGQRNVEGALINLKDLSIRVLEKEYNIEGEKMPYFSELFLECNTDLSIKESIRVMSKVAKDLTKIYYDEDFEKVSQIKEAIYEDMDDGVIQLEEVAEKIFDSHPQVRMEYMEKLQEAGVREVIHLEGREPEKKLGVHKFKIDNGIKLDIPVEIYRNKDIVEFINNPDGTISIMIKNISEIKQGN